VKAAIYAGVALAAFLFHTTAFQLLPHFPLYPDLILALAIHGGLAWGRVGGAQFGALLGLLGDLLSYGAVGVNFFSKGLIGFAIGALRERYINDSLTSRVILVIAATGLDLLIYNVITDAFFGSLSPSFTAGALVPQVSLNLIAALLVLPALKKMDTRIDRYQEETGAIRKPPLW